jgi:hypothetical protein
MSPCWCYPQAFSWFERENITAKAALARWLVALGRATMVRECQGLTRAEQGFDQG